ncbi:MAG: CBS domain-containing protein [Gammaproteobacteria bacterium]
MKTIKQLLNEKGHVVVSIAAGDSVFDAIKLMAEKGIGALVVMDGPKLVGVISERDYARKVILRGRSSNTTPIREIMSAPVVCARPEHTVEECMALVTEKRIRHLPVLQGTELVGMISIGDLVKSIIAEQQFVIEQLESYIAG